MRFFLFLLLVAAGWVGYLYLMKPIVAWFEPKIQIVESQKEAMDKLHSILGIWNGSTEKLEQSASNRDQLFSWMNDGQARESLDWLLAQELGARGKCKEAHAMLVPLLDKQMEKATTLPPQDREQVMRRCYDLVHLMLDRGDSLHAEKVLDHMIVQGDGGDVDMYVEIVKLSSDMKAKAGKFQEAAALVEKIKTDRVWNRIHKDETVKQAVRLLLLSDEAQSIGSSEPVARGRELAKSLLNRARMTSCPEMGIVLLSEMDDLYSRKELTVEEVNDLSANLEKALICFRASEADMGYVPEIMVGMARMELLKSHTDESGKWLDRAEGAAMTLGVDKPRILSGQSIKEDVTSLRADIAQVVEGRKMLASIEDKLSDADTYIKNKAWGLADSSLDEVRDMIQQHTVFARGYMPVCLYKRAKMYVGQSKWEDASAVYEKLIADWNAMSDEEKQILDSNLKTLSMGGLYETVHKELSAVCLKLDRITRSRQLMQVIGEGKDASPAAP